MVCFKDEVSQAQAWNMLLSNEAGGTDKPKTSIFDMPEIRRNIIAVKSYDLALFENTLNPLEKHVQHFNHQDPKKVLDLVLANLNKKTNLDQIIKRQMKQLTWIRAGYVPPIEDSGRGIITFPGQCLVVQMALRQDNEILFNAGLFDLMNPVNKAGLVLHETLYKISKIFGAPNSKKVHSLVGLFFNRDYLLSYDTDSLRALLLENLYGLDSQMSAKNDAILNKCKADLTKEMRDTLCELSFTNNLLNKDHLIKDSRKKLAQSKNFDGSDKKEAEETKQLIQSPDQISITSEGSEIGRCKSKHQFLIKTKELNNQTGKKEEVYKNLGQVSTLYVLEASVIENVLVLDAGDRDNWGRIRFQNEEDLQKFKRILEQSNVPLKIIVKGGSSGRPASHIFFDSIVAVFSLGSLGIKDYSYFKAQNVWIQLPGQSQSVNLESFLSKL